MACKEIKIQEAEPEVEPKANIIAVASKAPKANIIAVASKAPKARVIAEPAATTTEKEKKEKLDILISNIIDRRMLEPEIQKALSVLKEELIDEEDMYLKFSIFCKTFKIGLRLALKITSAEAEKELKELESARVNVKTADNLKLIDKAIEDRKLAIQYNEEIEISTIEIFNDFQRFIKEVNKCPNNHCEKKVDSAIPYRGNN